MLKSRFYIEALKSGLYLDKAWLVSAHALTQEDPEAWRKNPYAYRIVRLATGYFFVKPETLELELIEDADTGKPLIDFYEVFTISSDDCPLIKESIETDAGCLLANYLTLYYPFGTKIGYIDDYFGVGDIEKKIVGKLKDTPSADQARKDDEFYIDEFLKFGEACDFLQGLTQLCCWAGTEKSLSTHPDVPKRKAELFEQFKDKLDDPIVIAFISKELRKLDSEHLKGDPSENFYLSAKSREVVRSKLFLLGGAESGLSDDMTRVDLIKNSLVEGVEVESIPTMINSLRAASFNRGAQTELGGVSVKELLRALANLRVKPGDCKTIVGKEIEVDSSNSHRLVNRYVIVGNTSVHIANKDEAGAYLGKRLMVRSPQYCLYGATDFCEVCVGSMLAANPLALPIAGADTGSTFLSIYLAKAHGKTLMTEEFELEDILH